MSTTPTLPASPAADDHLRYYAGVVNTMAAADPRQAVGGLWDEIGRLQLDFLVSQGLRAQYRLLDFGCGCLRAGLHLISFLGTGNYHGVDISWRMIEAAERHLREAGLDGKQPWLALSRGNSFDWFPGQEFDVVLAQSVLTHMPLTSMPGVFAGARRVLAPGGVFYATWFPADQAEVSGDRTLFRYPLATVSHVAQSAGLRVTALPPEAYPHPRGQRMLELRA